MHTCTHPSFVAEWGVGASEGQMLLVTFLVIMIKYLTEAAEERKVSLFP